MTQLEFDLPENPSLRQQADAWIEANPEIYELFKRFARNAAAHRRRFGVKLLAERVRWEIAIESHGDDFKVNNNFTAYIARRLLEDIPEIGGLIETRKVRA